MADRALLAGYPRYVMLVSMPMSFWLHASLHFCSRVWQPKKSSISFHALWLAFQELYVLNWHVSMHSFITSFIKLWSLIMTFNGINSIWMDPSKWNRHLDFLVMDIKQVTQWSQKKFYLKIKPYWKFTVIIFATFTFMFMNSKRSWSF